MPVFWIGEQKNAVIPMQNPTDKGFEYNGCIYFSSDLREVSEKTFHLAAKEQRQVSFPVTMPVQAGVYPVHIGVFSGGSNIALYKATEDVEIVPPAVELIKVFIRQSNPTVSEAYSGWIALSGIGGEQNLALFGSPVQAGIIVRNPTSVPVQVTSEMYNYHWVEPNNYTTTSLQVPSVEPQRFLPAPTGLPYSSYQYEADVFLPPNGTLLPGKTGFIYSSLYYQSRRWNNVWLSLTVNGYGLSSRLLYSGWYSY